MITTNDSQNSSRLIIHPPCPLILLTFPSLHPAMSTSTAPHSIGRRSDSLDRSSSTLHSPSLDRHADLDPYLSKEKDDTEVHVVPPPPPSDDDYPDGGLQAWLVVVGGLFVTMSTFGYVNAWGVRSPANHPLDSTDRIASQAFQDYYENVLLVGTSPSTIAWIGSIQYSLVFLPALVAGRLFDIGQFRIPLTVATLLLLVCTFLIAECTEYWQLLLCQGFGVGLSCGIVFGPTMGIVAHWFKKRRSTALGIIACGSSVGGTVFPIAFRNLTISVGFKWTMRIIGFILVLTLGVANLTLKRRLPPSYASGGLFNFKQFRSPAYSFYTAAGFVAFLGLYTVLTYVDAAAPSQGISGDLSFYLVSIANAASGVGRITSGIAADRVGPLTLMTPFTAVAGIMTFVWPFVHGRAPVVVVTVFYGISSGAYAGLLAAPMMAFGETADVGRRTGMFMTVMSFGALAGPPISGAINVATGGYHAVGIYAGTAVMISVVLLSLSRYCVLGGWRGKI
ncbi:MFS general substrate transporter [Artomyces pyxidatus]|uniref:MFS general substrate transporter n=1 Tax=Artomyces pyxidatus TaxID=48021 RepID=A0ACB8T4M4_9AGAM|nr:MFS general substrate transporter [Artomyces pyxidatus]